MGVQIFRVHLPWSMLFCRDPPHGLKTAKFFLFLIFKRVPGLVMAQALPMPCSLKCEPRQLLEFLMLVLKFPPILQLQISKSMGRLQGLVPKPDSLQSFRRMAISRKAELKFDCLQAKLPRAQTLFLLPKCLRNRSICRLLRKLRCYSNTSSRNRAIMRFKCS